MPEPPPRKRRRLRRILIVLMTLVLALPLILLLALPPIVRPILRGKLESLVSNHLNASLHVGELSYRFPYTLNVRDARLVARSKRHDGIEVLRIASATITLDELPVGKGPLLIHSIDVREPSLHLVRTHYGDVVSQDILKPRPPDDPQKRRLKLSDVFRLRRLVIDRGKIVYEDRTRPDLAPTVWEDLTTNLNIVPKTASQYAFRVSAGSAPHAELVADGSIDIDELVLRLEPFTLAARADANADTTALPATVQQFVQRYGLHGALRLRATADVPLRRPRESSLDATIELSDASAHLPDSGQQMSGVGLKLALHKPADQMRATAQLTDLAGRAGPARVALSRADGTIDFSQRTWTIDIPQLDVRTLEPATQPTTAPAAKFALLDGAAQFAAALRGSLTDGTLHWSESTMTATLHDLALHLPKFPQPITSIDGRVRLEDGELIFEGVSGKYGEDFAMVTVARMPLDEHVRHRVEVRDLAGQIDFHPPSPPYPAKLGPVLAQLKPSGPFWVRGNFSVKRAPVRPRGEWDLVVTSQFGAFALTEKNIPLNQIDGRAHLTRQSIQIERLVAESLGGTFSCTGAIDPRRPVSYAGHASLNNIDLAEVAQQFAISTKPDFRMIGRANAQAEIRGDHAVLDALRMDGEVAIFDGHLWQIPVIERVADETKVTRDGLTAGEAAALFEVRDRRIHLRRAAISSPALGLQGGGIVGFDGTLDLNVVAAPLGDWERNFKKMGIPLVSDVTGAIAGTMQKVLNAATSRLLYEFRVTGTHAHPKLETIPTPMLSDTAAMVFEGMFKKDRRLIETLREREREREREKQEAESR